MKKTSILSLVFYLLLPFTGFAASLKDSTDTLTKYNLSDVTISSALTEKDVDTKVQEILKVLEDTVEIALKEKKALPPELVQQLVRVAGLTFTADPSMAAAEILEPLYQKNKKAFEKALKNLPKKDRLELEDSLNNSTRENDEGNG